MINDLGFVEAWEAMKTGHVISTDYSEICPTMGIQKLHLPVSDIVIKSGGIKGSNTLVIDYSNQTDKHDGKIFFELQYNQEGEYELMVAKPLVIEKSTGNIFYICKNNYSIDIDFLMSSKFIKYDFGKTPSITMLRTRGLIIK